MRIWIATLVIGLFCVSTAWAAELANPRTMTFPPLAFNLPKAERVLLKNGTPVYLLQDRELPIVTVSCPDPYRSGL